jgi:aminoacrylate hydrolase
MLRFAESDGCRLAYEVIGHGPRILFIQGVGVHGSGWLPQTDELASQYSCLTFDNRGLGQSVPASRPITVDRMADDARAAMDAAGWDSAHVVGHSLGGLVALRLALNSQSRVRSLALLCTFPNGRSAAPLTPRMMWLGLRSRVGTRRMRRMGFLRLVLSPDAKADPRVAERLADLFGHDLADQPPIVHEQLRAMRADDPYARLGELNGLKTLVVSATYDPIAPPAAGRALAAAIPGAKYMEISGASHGLPITHAAEVNRLIQAHLNRA